ncbi:C40 family peptidase [Zooshikella harenae]|uniref:C40 family peptidase n=1 Tax=Zooshikella harenae TaxID=2827238 RepID=A0ABS5ZEW2_9GAMM|nr:NlpC/P60 family protein [Zooshikella harenae]MBU2712609.1 C40 family peptidase [Zooshikella harenae]
MVFRIFKLVVLIATLQITGCVVFTGDEDLSSQNEVKTLLNNHYQNWQGTPYRYGGTTKNGIDCSAFIQQTYKKLFDVKLPRSSRSQIKVGKRVPYSQAMYGDLVFFHNGRKVSHVGIFMGESKFLHVSTRKGVTISSINSKYWSKRLYRVNRVLAN